MIIYIKYMKCRRCILMVIAELDLLGIRYKKVELGCIELYENLSIENRKILFNYLKEIGFEIIEDKILGIVERIKGEVYTSINEMEDIPNQNFSDRIVAKLYYSYSYLFTIFRLNMNMTIQKFINLEKVKKIKEMLLCRDLSLTEIAYKLHFGNLQYLCRFFKKNTNYTTTEYLKMEK